MAQYSVTMVYRGDSDCIVFPSTSQQSQDSGSESQLNTSSLKEALERFNHSRTPSASSRKSSHTAVSDPACKLRQLLTLLLQLFF